MKESGMIISGFVLLVVLVTVIVYIACLSRSIFKKSDGSSKPIVSKKRKIRKPFTEGIHAYRWTTKDEVNPFVFSVIGVLTPANVLTYARKRFRNKELKMAEFIETQQIRTSVGVYALIYGGLSECEIQIGDLELKLDCRGQVLLWDARVPASIQTTQNIQLARFTHQSIEQDQ